MALTEIFSGSETVSTTEHSLTTDTAGPDTETSDAACFVMVETQALIETEEYVLKLYEKCRSGDSQVLVDSWTILGEQCEDIFRSPYFCLMHGWDFTLTKVAGTDRTLNWSIRSYGAPTEYVTGSETVSTTEHSLTTDTSGPDSTTDDKAVQAWIDLTNLTDADIFMLTGYEKARSGDTQRTMWMRQMRGGMANPLLVVPVQGFLHGWDLTLDKISGTDRAINWSLRSVV